MKQSFTPEIPTSFISSSDSKNCNTCYCQNRIEQPYKAPKDVVDRILRFSRSLEVHSSETVGTFATVNS
ncbi:MAG TPA: hypothetical protein DEP18_06095 [Flavobacteriales bacterium]|nr:hypothetical protein [Flavobacteriales bacterium]